MGFLRRSLGGLFLLALTLGLLSWGAQVVWLAVQVAMAPPEPGGPARERVFAANVLRVEARTITPELTAFGEVRSRRTLEVRAPAGGTVIALADGFADGAEVAAGQVLVRIDPGNAQAARDVAASDMATAEAEAREAARAIPLARDELAGAEAQAALRARALERQQSLVARGAGTEALVQEAELAQNAAAQAVLAARANVAAAEARLDQAGAKQDRAQIALAGAERALGNLAVRAEFGGVLAGVSVVAGGIVSPNEKLVQIIDPAALEVSFRLSTSQYARLLDAQGALIPAQLTIALDVGGAQIATSGRLARVGAEVGAGQTGRLIYADLAAARGFRPGDFVTVRIAEPDLANVALLPASAVGADGRVLVLGPGDRLDLVAAEVLRRQGDDVIVAGGGLAGREVVAERTPLLGAGIKVDPQRPGQVAAPDAEASAEMVAVSAERRAELVALVEANTRLGADIKAQILAQLAQDLVPVAVIDRLTAKMGG